MLKVWILTLIIQGHAHVYSPQGVYLREQTCDVAAILVRAAGYPSTTCVQVTVDQQ